MLTPTFARHFRMTTASGLLLLLAAIWAQSASGEDFFDGLTAMKASRFEEARQIFLPLAQGGNADAEELIGVMYAMGLGVDRDDERAFEWYLRASLKGHPGAQSGIGWYYEVGRGIPAPDLVRAYTWYVLSAIGGDPDAAISMNEVVKKMTPEQIAKADILISDYKDHLYPED